MGILTSRVSVKVRTASLLLLLAVIASFSEVSVINAQSSNPVQGPAGGFCIHWPTLEQYANPTYQRYFLMSGATWTRGDVQRIDTTDKFKDMYATYHSLGIKNLGILDASIIPAAIQGNFTLDDWREAVRTTMTNYRGLLDAIEIWNEPDWAMNQMGYWDGSAEHYYNMLAVAYSETKSIDPNVLVVAGSIANIRQGSAGETLLKGIFALGASTYSDAVSFHYYPWYTVQTPAQVVARIYGITRKPIWITEFSALYDGEDQTGYTEQTQANWMSAFFASIDGATVKPQVVIWYMFHTPSPTGEDPRYTVLDYDYGVKPAYEVFKNRFSTVSGYLIAVKSKTTGGVEISGLIFQVDGRTTRTPFQLTMQGNHTFSARIIPMIGNAFAHFVAWQDETGATVSTQVSFTYNVQSNGKTFYAIYALG